MIGQQIPDGKVYAQRDRLVSQGEDAAARLSRRDAQGLRMVGPAPPSGRPCGVTLEPLQYGLGVLSGSLVGFTLGLVGGGGAAHYYVIMSFIK